VGLNIGKRNVNPSVQVRGKEDGTQAVNFESWLIPYDAIIQALRFKVTDLADSQLELRSPGLVTRLDPKQLRNDPELEKVFSIQDLETLFGVKAEFNINDYAIELQVPWQGQKSSNNQPTEQPVILEGLPQIRAPAITLTAIDQRININGTEDSPLEYRGDFSVVGSLLGGSYFLSVNQPDLKDRQTWNIAQAQWVRQTDKNDYLIGSHLPFWNSQGGGQFWGLTMIHREGFEPPFSLSGDTPTQRLQANQLGLTVSGAAEPGTLVRLTQGVGERIVGEVLVDTSGIYRFPNVRFGSVAGGNYRLLLYPQGQLTAKPKIENVNFSTLVGQIPVGASAVVVSGGWRHITSLETNPWGKFADFRGGVQGRWGVTEDLTVGVGAVYDQSWIGVADFLFKPKQLPVEVAVAASAREKLNVLTNIKFQPSNNLNLTFNGDRESNRLNFSWRLSPLFALTGNYDSQKGKTITGQMFLKGKNSATALNVALDGENKLSWVWNQSFPRTKFKISGNETGLSSELIHNLSRGSLSNSQHLLGVTYETNNQNENHHLSSLTWRYHSQRRDVDGSYLWESQLGYAFGSEGSGLIASLSTAVIPGLLLRSRYQGVSLTADESTFSIELVSSLNVQKGMKAGDRQSEHLRTQGGILIQPFFDINDNGQWDGGEPAFTDSGDLLILNNKPIKSWSVQRQSDRVLVRVPPDTYRLDLDPAGFPTDWQTTFNAIALNVQAGTYTPILVPLVRSYSISGVVTKAGGKPINGAKIEAVKANSDERVFSLTNEAGVFYLERLRQGTYTITINGKPAQPVSIKLDKSSEPFQEVNFQAL
jgi:hypothetical protein